MTNIFCAGYRASEQYTDDPRFIGSYKIGAGVLRSFVRKLCQMSLPGTKILNTFFTSLLVILFDDI